MDAIRRPGLRRRLTVAFGSIIGVMLLSIPGSYLVLNNVGNKAVDFGRAGQRAANLRIVQEEFGQLRQHGLDYAAVPTPQNKAELRESIASLARIRNRMAVKDPKFDVEVSGLNVIVISDERQLQDWRTAIDTSDTAATTLIKEVDASANNPAGRAAAREKFSLTMDEQVELPVNAWVNAAMTEARAGAETLTRAVSRALWLMIMMLALAVVVALILAIMLPRSIIRRLDDLGDMAHRLAGGELDARANDDTAAGDDEIADLVRDFNAMAGALQVREQENLNLQRQLQASLLTEQERATRDPLTGLRNHRYFQDALAAELERCARTGGMVSIAIIDLDNFKQVNDRFGHQEGDAVLLRATQGIADNLRAYDMPARLGGEEFGVIFPETTPDDARAILQRIAAYILPFGPNGEALSFSAGVATFPTHGHVQAELYHHADEAAYTAKLNGKNQTVIYDPMTVIDMNSEERVEHRSREAILATATTLAQKMDAKDPYGRHHSELTAVYAATLARALGMDEDVVKEIHRAGQLHDVGKVAIPDAVVRKAGRLTEAEHAQMQMHPEFSFRILENADIEPVATWVRHHHEHWNGGGYPSGIAGEDIPLGSRILHLAEAFETMTSDRAYRRALPLGEALSEMIEQVGREFDPQIVPAMFELVVAGVFAEVRAAHGLANDLPDTNTVHNLRQRLATIVTSHTAQNVYHQTAPPHPAALEAGLGEHAQPTAPAQPDSNAAWHEQQPASQPAPEWPGHEPGQAA